jgi:hypothetical protein
MQWKSGKIEFAGNHLFIQRSECNSIDRLIFYSSQVNGKNSRHEVLFDVSESFSPPQHTHVYNRHTFLIGWGSRWSVAHVLFYFFLSPLFSSVALKGFHELYFISRWTSLSLSIHPYTLLVQTLNTNK